MLRGHGSDFDSDQNLKGLIENPLHHSMILFPGKESLNLTHASVEAAKALVPPGKRLVIMVIDGTWSAAKNMIKNSKVLSSLPKLSFEVNTTSIYEIRKQPSAHCLSTVEAVSALFENLKAKELCMPVPSDGHLKMIESFKKLISSQHSFESNPQHRQAKRFRKAKTMKNNECQ